MRQLSPEYFPLPKLSQQVKEMNGRSGKRLSSSIDKLNDLLDEKHKVQATNEDHTDDHSDGGAKPSE